MNGVFRHGKGIAASLLLAAAAWSMKYGQSWLFRSVESPDSAIVFLDEFAQAKHSLSPQRSPGADFGSSWSIAVVTNRLNSADSANVTQGSAEIQAPETMSLTLPQQFIESYFGMPDTTYGFTSVALPLNRLHGQCDMSPDSSNPVTIDELQAKSEQEFFRSIQSRLSQSKAQDVLVFVHGFNVTLEQSVARVAQMAEDMPFHGVVIVFSWQSAGRPDSYLLDERLAERYFWNLAELLAELRSQLQPRTRLHVVAHSMGNRVTLRALNALAGTIDPVGQNTDTLMLAQFTAAQRFDSGKLNSRSDESKPQRGVLDGSDEIPSRFPQWASWHRSILTAPAIASLVMAAPDVDAGEFGRFVNSIRHVCKRMVLYASDTDYALEASRKVHQGKFRAGDSRANLKIEALTIVRVSGVDKLDPLGHSYYGSNAKVLSQLSRIMRPEVINDGSQTISDVARVPGRQQN